MPLLGRRRSAPGDDSLIDRNPQNIPLPLGDTVVRGHRRTPAIIKWWRQRAATIVTLLGLGAAGIGAYLAVSGQSVPVYLQGNTVHVGSLTLTQKTPNVYVGAAILVITQNRTTGAITAASAEVVAGEETKGVCTMTVVRRGHLSESCTFWVGAKTLTSVDTLDVTQGSTWHRTYSDGKQVTMSVPPDGAVIPVPFPVGR